MALRKVLKEQIAEQSNAPGTIRTDQGTLAKITRWVHLGMNEKNIAINLGIHPVTFSRSKKTHPQLQAAIDKGRCIGEEEVTSALEAMIRDPKSRGHASAVFFKLKHKYGWSDTALAAKESSTAPVGVKFELMTAKPTVEDNADTNNDSNVED